MSAYSVSDRDSWTEHRPDKPLVVKVHYDGVNKRITFSSSRSCTFDLLRHKIEQCYALSATSYAITYTDDDGETTDITTDADLTEAIRYFHAGSDEPISSAASILSGRSFGRGKITLRFKISVDYDGPSLSDTSSLASLDEFKDRNGSAYSLSLGSSLSVEPEDDAVTVSSKDMGSKYDVFRGRGGPKTIMSGPSREPLIRRPRPPESDWDQQTVSSAPRSSNLALRPRGAPSAPPSKNFLAAESTNGSSAGGDPAPVFERLKLNENLSGSQNSSYGSSTLQSERGAAWLRDQNARTIKAMLGTLPDTSESESDQLSISEFNDAASAMSGELSLQKDPRGKFYYSYTAGSAASGAQSSCDSGYDDGSSMLYDADVSDPNPSVATQSRPNSMQVTWMQFQKDTGPLADLSRRATASTSYAAHFNHAYNYNNHTSHNHRSHSEPVISHISPDVDIPPELLPFISSQLLPPPENPTDCSNCGALLETLRYVCSTCGEKKGPMIKSGSESVYGDAASLASFGKGKERESSASEHLYPPRRPSYSYSPSVSSWTLVGEENPFHDSHAVKPNKPIKPLPPIPQSPGSTISHTYANSTTDYSPRSSSIPQSSSSYLSIPGPSNGLSHSGYELCFNCIESAGMIHALEVTLEPGTSPVSGGRPPPSPEHAEAAEQAMSQWRRSAPKKKGQLRHAYLEKVWGPRGWDDVEQDDATSPECSACGTVVVNKRYKCASCKKFNLCRACYSQVHEIHPTHAFLLVPDRQIRTRSEPALDSSPLRADNDEQSMTHPDVKCAHCMQDIIGARFHCAVCPAIDICSNCESAGLPGNLDEADGGHSSSHIMIKIPYPLSSEELQVATRRVKQLWDRDAPTLDTPPRSRRDSLTSSYARTVMAGSGSSLDLGGTVVGHGTSEDHGLRCSHCSVVIRGVRYQCAMCVSKPTPYSLCASCEERSYVVHDAMHIFFKLPKPVDRPIESNFALLPTLYRAPAGPHGGVYNSQNPKEYLANLFHGSALCDRCMQRISGEWFRCVYCAKDLCDVCQSMDTHDSTHFFMVFKSEVDMNHFRRFAQLENANGSPPVLSYPVYNS
ncbi:hypothetical protein QCA50_011070 [Cerrena zonata]|uniref:Uncharacterized protein n=1 Tax=Cerrena zonata TaxID=2478898 RepID=A0AAW0FWZ7_9APHY